MAKKSKKKEFAFLEMSKNRFIILQHSLGDKYVYYCECRNRLRTDELVKVLNGEK